MKKLNNVFLINKISVNYTPNIIIIYHIYESTTKNYAGRWYNTDILNSKYKLDGKKKIFTYYISQYEDENRSKLLKNVKVEIFFSEKGWDKFINIF